MPLDLDSLTALGDLAERDEARPLPRPRWRPLEGFPRRSRLASYAGAAAAAGLVCGLVAPSPAALAQPLTAAVRSTLFASAEPVATVAVASTTAPRDAIGNQPASATDAIAVVASAALPHGLDPVVTAPRPTLASLDPGPAIAAVAALATWKVTTPLPAGSGTGRRIVYAEKAAHVWVVDADGTVLRDYKVTGRPGRPKPATYRVYSKSTVAVNPGQKLRFELMVRFAHGLTGAPIGFHTIPRSYDGIPIQAESDLGRAIGSGGCVRQSRSDATWLYAWVTVGDRVVVVR